MSACDTLTMPEANVHHQGPWTEDEYLALDESINRIELIDGGLWVSPGPHMNHQGMGYRLHRAMDDAAAAADLAIYEGVNVRIEPGTIVIPDLVVVNDFVEPAVYVEAADTVLVAEVLSPSSKTMDRITKRHAYAAAKIDWYLLVDPGLPDYQEVTLSLFRRKDEDYVENTTAKGDDPLVLEQPFPIEIRPNKLLRPRSRPS